MRKSSMPMVAISSYETPSRRWQIAARCIGLCATVAGVAVLLGWVFDIPALIGFPAGAATMKPAAAIAIALAGISLWLLARATTDRPHDAPGSSSDRRGALLRRLVAATVSLLGAITLVEAGLSLGAGHASVRTPNWLAQGGIFHHGRMASGTALALTLIGIALLLADRPRRDKGSGTDRSELPSQYLALGAALIGLVALIGYAYGVPALFSVTGESSIALPTTLLLCLLGIGVLLARPGRGLMVNITSAHVGGTLARRLLPLAVLLPFGVGWLRLVGERSGLYDGDFGLALFAASNIIIFTIVILRNASSLNRVDAAREEITQSLRDSEERFSTAFHSNPAGMLFMRLEDLCYVDVNESFVTVFGYSREEVIGRSSLELGLMTEDVRAQLIRRLTDEDNLSQLETTLHARDGSVRNVLLSAHTIMMGGLAYALMVLVDITERKRAEDAQRLRESSMLQTQKMEALGTLASGIAHDFNNLLTAIIGNTKLAREDLPDSHPVQQNLAEVYKAGMRAANLVGRILTFGRQQQTAHIRMRLRPIVEEAVNLLRATIPVMVEIRTVIADKPLEILGDPTHIHQVLMNLGSNAAHAMGRPGGVLTIEVDALDVDGDMAATTPDLHVGLYVRLSVSDTGCGMDKPTQKRIFDPFFTTKGPGEGTGLGLSVVHGIVQSHDGAMNVYSESGRGTVFNLYFPAAVGGGVVAADFTDSKPMPGSGRVLYVDDEETLVLVITRMLQRLGYTVTGFNDPRTALATFGASPQAFDVVISDLSMPGLSGLELARQVLALRPDIPFVITSGYLPDHEQEAALAIGVRAFLAKPTRIEELGATLHELLAIDSGKAPEPSISPAPPAP